MNTLICISSKFPNPFLHKCIDALYKYQIKDPSLYKVCIVDSDSSNTDEYTHVKTMFPNIEIHFAKNKHYEYGAWKYILEQYPDYKTYMCIQDTIFVKEYIDLDKINDTTAYTYYHHSGYNSHISIKEYGISLLENSGLEYKPIIDSNFILATHSSFIVSNAVMKDIFATLKVPPINKAGSCAYERNFGLYFILKGIATLPINNLVWKHHGQRS
jgi:hypothetical protein